MHLNPQQSQILEFPVGDSLLVLAGAGSGKTTVMAHRAMMIAKHLPADQRLQMLTFSNKAAKEMKERVLRLGGALDDRIAFDTFHSFGLKLIKGDPEGHGLLEGFSLLNETDVKRSMRRLAKGLGLPKDIDAQDRARLDPMAWLNTWSLSRQAGYDVRNKANRAALCDRLVKAHALTDQEVALAWETLAAFEQEKANSNTVDFDDLIYFPLLRIARDEAFRQQVQESIGHIIVDEYQDTNRIQYEIVRRLGQGHCGVTCVGDDDQSIYGWRGAEVSNLKRFIAHFRASELRLEQNYRSTQQIVDHASRLIAHNSSRLEKSPFSLGEQGSPPEFSALPDSYSMADAIAQSIACRINEGVKPGDISVLYRTNRMAMLIEQGLRAKNIPYHVVGGMSLFDRTEVVATTSALRLARNPHDIHAFLTLTDYIDGVGRASAYAIIDWMEANPGKGVCALPDEVPGVAASKLAAVRAFHSDLVISALTADTAVEFVEWVITGPMELLSREKNDQLRTKREQHLKSLVDTVEGELAERQATEPDLTWRDILVEIGLRDARQSEAENGQVTLSTLHRAKGLEWDHVYIAGMSEGLLPLASKEADALEDDAGYSHLEEERRLGYVGFTRARQTCELFHADRYAFPGMKEDKTFEPSRFVGEMGLEPTTTQSLDYDDEPTEGFDVARFKREFSGMMLG